MNPRPMRFSESCIRAASVSLSTSSARSDWSLARAIAVVAADDQPAQQRLVAHDLHVVLDARPVWHSAHQARHVAHIANRLQILVPVQLLDQRDHVDRPRRLRQVHHARVNPPVRIQRKVLDPQMLRRLVVSKIVEQDRAQNRTLRLHVRRKTADRIFGSCHSSEDVRAQPCRILGTNISEYKAKRKMNCAEAVKPATMLWKLLENPSDIGAPSDSGNLLMGQPLRLSNRGRAALQRRVQAMKKWRALAPGAFG